MSTSSGEHDPSSSTGDRAQLQRMLQALEGRKPGRLELMMVIVIGLATLGSTWCGYQATQWNTRSSTLQAQADVTDRQAAEDVLAGLQLRTFDGVEVLEYMRALRSGDSALAEGLLDRMRPSLQAAVRGAIADGLLTDPTTPGPFHRPEYVLEVEEEALTKRAAAAAMQKDADFAGRQNGRYVQGTLLFATVLFFGGITGTFGGRRIRIALGVAAAAMFIGTCALLMRLPVCPS